MNSNQKWSKDALNMLKRLNNYNNPGSPKSTSSLFFVDGKKVGILTPKVAEDLKKYPHVFKFYKNTDVSPREIVELDEKITSYKERTEAMAQVINDMVKRDVHVSLRGWRDEQYEVASSTTEEPLFNIERAAVSIFGVKAYGSHMNGYVNHPEKGLCLWIARRSKLKATFPGMLDNMVAGGISKGIGIHETMVKECQEEAGIPKDLAEKVTPVGMISYIHEDERGIQPEVQYCFDLEIPSDFTPTVTDGEVEGFTLYPVDEVKRLILRRDFKPNCAAVTLHFLIRKGFILPDQVPDYIELLQLLHHQF